MTMREIAKMIIMNRRAEESREAYRSGSLEKCKRCFHYRFVHPQKVKWDHTFVAVGHVCDYNTPNHPLRELVPHVPLDYDEFGGDFSYWCQTTAGERTIKDRLRLGECEFKEVAEPRPKSWVERDDVWDSKYKRIYLGFLEQELRAEGTDEAEIKQIIEEELDFKNTIYYNER